MMRVYQPLCPDITFRLAADLSPDTLEESEESTPSSSTSSSSEGEELKLKLYQETLAHGHNDTRNHNNRFAAAGSASASAPVAPTKSAKDIYNHGHVTHATSTPSGASTSAGGSSSAPSQAPTTSLALGVDNESSCAAETDDVEKCHEELNCNEASDCATQTARSEEDTAQLSRAWNVQASASAATAARHGIKRSAEEEDDDDTPSPSPSDRDPPRSNERGHDDVRPSPEKGGSDRENGGDDDDDDDESIEDVSISHNVPMCPSPAPLSPVRTPAISRRVPAVAAEETGGASGSSSDSEGSALAKGSVVMHLDIIQKSPSKYRGPYTLACDVTPSPMQENITMANTLSVVSGHASGDASAATTPSASGNFNTTVNSNLKVPRRPRKLPEIPRKHQGLATASSMHVKSIFDEIQEALIKEVNDSVFEDTSSASDLDPAQQYPFIHKHMGHLFDKKRLLIGYATGPAGSSRSRNASTSSSVASEAGAAASVPEEDVNFEYAHARPSFGISTAPAPAVCSQERRRKNSDGDGSKRHSSSSMSTPYHDLEVTHRGMHRFIPRHADEVQIGIGDPIHVFKEFDDLWCEGVNLRSGERGIFPAMYANDLKFLEDSDGDDEHWKFTMRFLGTVEVTSSSGDFALCQAINRVAQHGRIKTASLCTLEINQYGIRMIDKSKEGHENQKFTNFFALKNISFCGTHPSNNRYFAFITKHPREIRFACHVFHSDRSTHRARDALGHAFKRFYQEYMAFTHPTEDIWIE